MGGSVTRTEKPRPGADECDLAQPLRRERFFQALHEM